MSEINRALGGYGRNLSRRDPITVHMALCQLPAEECTSDRHACPVCKKAAVTRVVREAGDNGVTIVYMHADGNACRNKSPYEAKTQ